MKPLTDYIEKIHELPEQTRKIAAGFSIVAAGILAIFIMHANITAQLAENTQNENPTAFNYMEKNGILSFINTFIINGTVNIFQILTNLSLPYLWLT